MKSKAKKPVKKPSVRGLEQPLHTQEPLAEKDEVKAAEKRTQRKSPEEDVEAELKIRGLK